MFEQGIKTSFGPYGAQLYIKSWASCCIYFPVQLDCDIEVSITVGLPEPKRSSCFGVFSIQPCWVPFHKLVTEKKKMKRVQLWIACDLIKYLVAPMGDGG